MQLAVARKQFSNEKMEVFNKMSKQHVLSICDMLGIETNSRLTKEGVLDRIRRKFPSFTSDQAAGIDIACKWRIYSERSDAYDA
jgi:hypothetical protein